MREEDEFFRRLSSEGEKRFRQWARDNYKVGEEISIVWHPVVKNECWVMNKEEDEKIKKAESL